MTPPRHAPDARRAGQPADPAALVDIPRLMTAYYTLTPDPAVPAQRVAFGTSGHRGSSFDTAFNEAHILAITESICRHRRQQGIDGPLFLGIDTHALSAAAAATAIEVLGAHGVDVMIDDRDGYTPTPVISHAILRHNRGRTQGRADGIVITPSHNPPEDGGFKYNPPHGGPAGGDITQAIQDQANALLTDGCRAVRRMPVERARRAATTHRHDYMGEYLDALPDVVNLEAIREADVTLGVDPLGGAGVAYWGMIAERYDLPIDVISTLVDPTFRFMTLDWDGRIRMDPSSPDAMRRLIALQDRYDVAWACDPDHDRHGIVARSAGLLPPNDYLAAAIAYLLEHRTQWAAASGIGKTVVSSSMIDRVVARHGRRLVEVPVGFKWFVEGLGHGSLAFAGEESAGASFVRCDGTAWTTDKDGILLGLLAAEMTAVTGRDPGELYLDIASRHGEMYYERIDAPATAEQKAVLARLTRDQIEVADLAGEPVTAFLTTAPGNGAPIGGIKLVTRAGWCAMRPSGTEDIYKLYAESFRSREHLQQIQAEAQEILRRVFAVHARPTETS